MNRDYEFGRGRGQDFGRGREDERERWERERGGEQRFGGYESGFRGDNRFSGGENQWGSRGMRGFGGPQWGNEGYTGGRDDDRWQGMERGGYGGQDRFGGMGMSRGGYGYGGGYGMGDRMGGMGMDQNRQQRTGRGPKGYQRSDERIREDVCEMLSDHDWLDASEIEIQVKSGEITLTGTVMDRQSKRLAEDLAEQARGVKDVHNQLRVQQEQQDQQRGREGNVGQQQRGKSEERTPRA
jgi:hypothetical protein